MVLDLTTKDMIGIVGGIMAAVGSAVFGVMKWVYKDFEKKLNKIDDLDKTVEQLKPKLESFVKTIDELQDAMKALQSQVDAFKMEMSRQLKAGDARFQTHELELEKSKRELLQTLITATTEARQYHDQANEDFVRKEDLEASVVMIGGRWCKDNCWDRK